MFVDCDDEVLGRRYTETRRRHPLAQGRPVADGIALERRLVAPLRARADLIIDSSSIAPADMRQQPLGRFSLAGPLGMSIFVTSFRSEEHTSELQSLMRSSSALSCLTRTTAPNYVHL